MPQNITVAAAILMLLKGVEAEHSVTLSSQSLCAVTGSTVKIPCTVTTPDHSSVTQREWYRVQSSEGEPRDLSTDPQYSGRVSVSTVTSDYLKVAVTGLGPDSKRLICTTICTLTNSTYSTYIWYKDRRRVPEQEEDNKYLYISGWETGSYSCAVRGHEKLLSPAVCVTYKKSCWSVTYSTQTICSLIGSSVDIHSYYTFPKRYKVTKVLWFIKVQADGESVDVREDEEYQGRVQYTQSSQNNCSLRITNLRERDAQTYRFRFYTDGGDYTGEPGVSLSVTDLKVTVLNRSDGYKTLICTTTCTLPNNPIYIWYRNRQLATNPNKNDKSLDVSSGEAGSYSCAVRGHEELRSPAVCVFEEKSCWSVTYSTQTICSLIGSSVNIHSYYTFPDQYKVTKVLWFIKVQADGESVDVREDEEYQGRVQYTQSSQNNCSLRITNLTERDAQTYRFRFYTDGGDYTGEPGVSLSVTDLKVTVSDWRDQYMTLSCITTCTLSNNPTYIWYKNGQRVSDCKSASCSVAAVSGAVSYSCAVEGHDSLLSPPVFSESSEENTLLRLIMVVLGVFLALTLISGALWMWTRRSSSAYGHSSPGESEQ
ncbi:B-cell receptor CD22-like, partial [Clarias magur]